MMWGCVSCEGVGPLVRVEGRLNGDDYRSTASVWAPPAICTSIRARFHFMDDNAPCHRAHKVRIWMTQQQITFMEV